ncbi:MAG: efflux RND transporter permease subunit [Gammaproteobacteria bacterium]|nr:MAG: efflux RND transporter permease subunit [Gammaproteobacteria bacterium]
MLLRLIHNHVFANLLFVLVLVLGTLNYFLMPREKDPTINFNWIQVMTFLPGASARDIEKKLTDPIEEAIRKVDDIRFVTSTSRESISSVLLRFEDIDERTFDKRVNDLRREVQTITDTELPEEAEDPIIVEITTDNALPVATVLVTSAGDDENLRFQTQLIEKEIERLSGVDNVITVGLRDPELQVAFDLEALAHHGLSPGTVVETVSAHFRDISAGDIDLAGQRWLVTLTGTTIDAEQLAALPMTGREGEIRLSEVAKVERVREEAEQLVFMNGQPGVMLWVTKKTSANVLDLVERLSEYNDKRNELIASTGVKLTLVDDQTVATRNAISVMETNAVLGLLFVLLITWLFLGSKISILTSIGIPFTLAGTFWFLSSTGNSINNSVLLGIIICLGMIVDDAVVVVESIFTRLKNGMTAAKAVPEALNEVSAPVLTSVLTTMAAFLPLMLIPGILGKFMFVLPLVVTVALAISLVEAFWMLPAHVTALNVSFDRPSRIHHKRVYWIHWIQIKYGQLLIKALRYPYRTLSIAAGAFLLAVILLVTEQVKIRFFAFDPIRLFYVNVTMPQGTPLEQTADAVKILEGRIRQHVQPGEVRGMASYAGELLTETEPLFGGRFGQIVVSLNPKTDELRDVEKMIEDIRPLVSDIAGPESIHFWALKDGPPTGHPISVKVRGERYDDIRRAVNQVKNILGGINGVTDISDDDSGGANELGLRLDLDAVRRSGLNPADIANSVRLLVDGVVVASFRHQGEEVEVRVRAQQKSVDDVESFLAQMISLPDGSRVALGNLVNTSIAPSRGNIRHHNFRRSITVEADLDKDVIGTVAANNLLRERWQDVRDDFPEIDLDFSGELDDIQESIDAIGVLFLFGLGMIYLILGAQFRSYVQPLLIIFTTVPMAATGVVLGLFMTGNPLSLFTLYGVVALGGIAVNTAIVMISAGNDRYKRGMSILHATFYAGRRRVIPILITSFTTIGGLFSLATGLGGKSLLWGPVATAIVAGLTVSTCFSLFLVPLFYRGLLVITEKRRA